MKADRKWTSIPMITIYSLQQSYEAWGQRKKATAAKPQHQIDFSSEISLHY